MKTFRHPAHRALAAALCIGAPGVTACMSDGECPVYDYEPASIQVSFRDAVTGEPVCDLPNAANPGKLFPLAGQCAYSLTGWCVRDDGGVSTTVELTVKGYAPVTVTFQARTGECGEALAPPPRQIDLTPDPDAD